MLADRAKDTDAKERICCCASTIGQSDNRTIGDTRESVSLYPKDGISHGNVWRCCYRAKSNHVVETYSIRPVFIKYARAHARKLRR